MKLKDILPEAFRDLGKLSDEELMKGQKLNPGASGNFKEVDGRVFYRAITGISRNDLIRLNKGLPSRGLHTLTVYSPNEYNKMRCFLGVNNSSGFCLKEGNPKGTEIVSLFSTQGSSGRALMDEAVRQGGRVLDCYAKRDPKTGIISGPLFYLYSEFGFKIDKNMNSGTPGEPYAIVNGVSDYVDDAGQVHPDNPTVVIFMIR